VARYEGRGSLELASSFSCRPSDKDDHEHGHH
jgi:hypothetical protein